MKLKLPILSRKQRPTHPPQVTTAKNAVGPGTDPRQPFFRGPTRPPNRTNPPMDATVGSNFFCTTLAGQEFFWMGSNRANFYRYMRDHIPIISSAVWTWVHLCATPQTFITEGTDSQKTAALKIIEELDMRILDNPATRQPAIEHIIEQFFLELFTVGRFAANIELSEDGKSIDFLRYHDTDRIYWQKTSGRWQPYQRAIDANAKDTLIPTKNFFYTALGTDINDPSGIEPLSCIPFVADIQEALAYDMAKSSHTAGNPRLHIAITPPVAFPQESEKEYQKRVNSYFDDTVDAFKNLDPEDTLFTWSDVEIKIIGSGMGNFAWRLNREQIIEDVITGLHLYPWALGRSHGTTKNWVESQFNVLMQVVDTVQNQAIALANWIRNKELKLRESDCRTTHVFAPNQDPFIMNKMNARETELRTVDKMVTRGYISKDEGAQRLGLPKAHQQDTVKPPEEPQK